MSRLRIWWRLAAVAVVLACLAPAPADAATVVSRNGVVYAAADGEANELTLQLAGDRVEFHDAGAVIEPGEGCERTSSDPHRASCLGDGATLRLGDGDDGALVAARGVTFYGGEGNDELTATAESDSAYGGAGDDSFDVDAESLGGSYTRGVAHPDGRYEVLEVIEGGLHGEAGDDRLIASRSRAARYIVQLRGGPGADTIAGSGGTDRVVAGDGDDSVDTAGDDREDDVSGGTGADGLHGDSPDGLRGDSGDDRLSSVHGGRLFGGDGSDVLDGGAAPSPVPASPAGGLLNGGSGADVLMRGSVTYDDRTAPVTVTPDGLPNDGEARELDNVHETVSGIRGGAGGDVLTGTEFANHIEGGRGDDVLTAGGGVRDVLSSGPGDDTLFALDGGLKTGPYRFPLLPEIDDQVLCGDAGDTAFVDPEDATGWGPEVSCGTVHEADGLGTVPVPQLPGQPAIPLPVECPELVARVCSGTVELRLAIRRKARAARRRAHSYVSPQRSPRLGRARYSIRRAKRRTVAVRVAASAKRRLRGRRKAEVWVTFSRPRAPGR